jgi:hypothetical protein
MSGQSLDDLLNRIEAIMKCGAGTTKELAKALEKPVSNIYDWIGQRRFEPSGEVALRMQTWAAKKTTQIAMAGRKLQTEYRIAYREVCKKRKD